jgi:hypothetical protein
MKRLAFLSFTIATLIAPIQVQAQQYDPVRNCVRFPQIPDPVAESRYMDSHPTTPVCPSAPDPQGVADALRAGQAQSQYDTFERMGAINRMNGPR